MSLPVPRPIVRNSGPLGSPRKPGAVEIGDEIFLEVVVAGHCVPLAALLAQPHPQAAVLRVDVLDLHAERRADAGEGIDHQPDQGAVAQTRRRRHSMLSSSARASAGSSTGVCPAYDVPGPAHRAAGLIGTTWPVTSQSNR